MIKSLFNIFKSKEEIKIYDKCFENVEWAFQFNNDEPVILEKPKNGETKLEIVLGNKIWDAIIFSDGKGNEFKIFAREQIPFYKFGVDKV